MKTSLTLTKEQFDNIKQHLFPEDGCEAVSILLCGRNIINNSCRLVVHKIFHIPYNMCSVRTPYRVKWCSDILQPILDLASKYKLSIVKIHSHIDYEQFSDVDNESDASLFPAFYICADDYESPHASVVMMKNDKMFGRVVSESGQFTPLDYINVVGDDVTYWFNQSKIPNQEFSVRHQQLFGERTLNLLSRLKVGVVGCSGTGSPVIEQLARLGIGELVLVDPDKIETKNLNRILNATAKDAEEEAYKVDSLKKAIDKMKLNTRVKVFSCDVYEESVIRELADCNFLFGCVDSVDARHLLNRISSFYIAPYIDLGVKLEADGKGGIDKVCGAVHYIQPGKSSLLSRKVYSIQDYQSAMLRKTDINEYNKLLESKYIKGIEEVGSPAVISVNMLCASIAVNEFLSRIHPFRLDSNARFAVTRFELVNWMLTTEPEVEYNSDYNLIKYIGRGSLNPLLDMPKFSSHAQTV